ncbi:MAG TPA: O-antigen ligase family protein, partial [Chloroflexota bacterium]
MDLSATLPVTLTRPQRGSIRGGGAALSAWTLGFALVAYLAMRDGGYATIVRSEVGIAIWWIILLGALAGVIPLRFGRPGWLAIGLLAGFAVWTGIASTWSESAESSVVELGREAAYLGFLVLAIALQGRAAARHTINGVACSIGLVTVLALLSRLHPQSFPVNVDFRFLGTDAGRRLSYPLNYWNALAAFVAIGVPLFIAQAIGARRTLTRALAAAMLPLSALCVYLTVSRGGVFELGVGLAVFMLLAPRRIEALTTVILGAAGSTILVWAAEQRPAAQTGLRSAAAIHAGGELLVLAVVVCSGVALLQAAVSLAATTHRRPARLVFTRRATTRATLVVGGLALIVALGVGVPAKLDHLWHQFIAPTGTVVPTSNANVIDRLTAINGDGRYQYWVAAAHAFKQHPLGGIGPGTFQFWWAQHATAPGPVLNAHSLYMETLAETGMIGFVLLVGLLLFVMAVAIRRALREPDPIRLWVS